MSPDNLPTYISLNQAATRYGVNVAVLRRSVESGIMRAVKINEEVIVADEDVAVVAAQVEAKDKGDELVSINEAGRRLNIPAGTVYQWYKYGWLSWIASGPRNAKLVSWKQAQALGRLHEKRSKRGRRLIPRGKELSEVLAY